MKKSRLWLIIGLMASFLSAIVFVPALCAATSSAGQANAAADGNLEAAAYLQDITFEKLPGKERVILVFSKASGAMIENKNSHSVVAVMANTYIPEDFRHGLGDGRLDNVYKISASQQDKDGEPWGYVTMEMKERVPYMVRKDGSKIFIDFNVAGLTGNANREGNVTSTKAQKPAPQNTAEGTASTSKNQFSSEGKPDPNRLISIDFQEANIKSVLRLLAEEGGVSIASGDDVKGNVTLSVKRATWQQAFETVLAVHGLGRVKEGDVFIVKTVDRMAKEEKTKYEEAKDRVKRQREQEEADQEKRVKDGRLPQITIEAKIVEMSRVGKRQLGVLWGAGVRGTWSGTDIGFIAGNSEQSDTGTSTINLNLPKAGAVGTAVNFPSSTSSAFPALGVIVASSNVILASKLEALETSGDGKIISAPRVTTIDSEPAKIGQGEEIPYVTRDKDGTPTIQMKDAKLELSVTPRITSEGKISMNISCSSKYADWKKVNKNNENPPLVASNVDSKVVVMDGDTIVLGGIMKTADTKSVTGIPWLSKIPVLGWLFKSEGTDVDERELMIFVTPKIVKTS